VKLARTFKVAALRLVDLVKGLHVNMEDRYIHNVSHLASHSSVPHFATRRRRNM
jgi:hypothetical protein